MLKLFTALEKEMAQKAFIIYTYEIVKKNKPITTIYFQLTMERLLFIFYTEILTGKVVLCCFFSSETKRVKKSTIQFFKSKSQYRT